MKPGEEIEIVGFNERPTKTNVVGIETFKKELKFAEAGDNVGLLIRNVLKKDVKRGMILAAPGSMTSGNSFEAQVYLLKEEEGGREHSFSSGFKPQVFFYIKIFSAL